MSITLNFELNDRDLAHFQAAMERSRKSAEGKSEADIIAAATAVFNPVVVAKNADAGLLLDNAIA